MSQKINIVLPDTYKSLINTFVSTYQKQYEKQLQGNFLHAKISFVLYFTYGRNSNISILGGVLYA